MTSNKGKYKATFGYCERCECFYPHGEYEKKFGQILCKDHMKEFEVNHPELKDIVKSRW